MGLLLPLIWMLGICFSISLVIKRNFEESITIGLLFNVLLIYIGTYFFNINIAIIITLILILVSILYFIIKVEDKKVVIKRYFSNGFIVFIILYLFVTIVNWQRGFNIWDEFSHWGPMIKEILRSNSFYNVKPVYSIVHMDYPPIVQLFEATWCKLSGGFSEAYCYRSIQMLTFSLMFPIMGLVKKNSKIFNIFISLIIMVLLSLSSFLGEYYFYQGVYIDTILGFLIGYSVIKIYINNDNTISIILALSVLLLVKEIALVFYLMIIIYYFFSNKFSLKKMLMIILIPLLFYFSWTIELSLYNVNHTGLSLNGFVLNMTIFNAYINSIINFKFTFGLIKLSYLQIVILTLFIILLSSYLNKNNRQKNINLAIIYLLGAIGYGITMLVLYHVAFSLYEGIKLASFERYIGTYVISSVYIIVVVILYNYDFKLLRKEIIVIILLISFISIEGYSNLKPVMIYKSATDKFVSDYNEITYFSDEDDKVFVITQYDIGYNGVILKYMLFPRIMSYDSIGEPKYEGDIWSKNYSEKEWEEILANNDYLYIYKTSDESLLNYLAEYIDINNVEVHKMYYINKNNGKIVLDKLDIY